MLLQIFDVIQSDVVLQNQVHKNICYLIVFMFKPLYMYTNAFFRFYTMKLVWFTVYIKGSQVKISKLSVMIVFIILAISADPDGMLNIETFYLSLHCMPKS